MHLSIHWLGRQQRDKFSVITNIKGMLQTVLEQNSSFTICKVPEIQSKWGFYTLHIFPKASIGL